MSLCWSGWFYNFGTTRCVGRVGTMKLYCSSGSAGSSQAMSGGQNGCWKIPVHNGQRLQHIQRDRAGLRESSAQCYHQHHGNSSYFLSGPPREVWKTIQPFQQSEADFFKRIWESKPANQKMTSNAQDFYKMYPSSPVVEMKKVMALGWISDFEIPSAHSVVFALQQF